MCGSPNLNLSLKGGGWAWWAPQSQLVWVAAGRRAALNPAWRADCCASDSRALYLSAILLLTVTKRQGQSLLITKKHLQRPQTRWINEKKSKPPPPLLLLLLLVVCEDGALCAHVLYTHLSVLIPQVEGGRWAL